MYKAQNIMPPEIIAQECQRIDTFCQAEYNADVAEAVVVRAAELEGYMTLTGKMLADAKWHYNDVLNSLFIDAVRDGNKARMQTSTLNKYIDSLCKDYQHLVDWCDRLNRATTHALDFARTLISKHKEEFRAAQFSNSPTRA